VIETTRLSIRRLGPGDEPFIVELLNQPSFIRNIGDRHVRTLEDATEYIRKGPAASYEKFGFGLFHVALKDTGTPIGICGLLKRDSLEDADLGFAYLEHYWGQGYALEAAEAVMDFGWKTVGLKRIVAITAPHNESSMRLLRKLGMQFEGVIQYPGSGDTNLFGITPPALGAIGRREDHSGPAVP
jgi:RimJ/RimL family protein N-acetyltransferase